MEFRRVLCRSLASGRDPGALALGEEEPRPLASLWDGLEVFAPYDDLEPATLAQSAGDALGKIGRASWRASVCQDVYISVAAVSLKKQILPRHRHILIFYLST